MFNVSNITLIFHLKRPVCQSWVTSILGSIKVGRRAVNPGQLTRVDLFRLTPHVVSTCVTLFLWTAVLQRCDLVGCRSCLMSKQQSAVSATIIWPGAEYSSGCVCGCCFAVLCWFFFSAIEETINLNSQEKNKHNLVMSIIFIGNFPFEQHVIF